jgi:hypothetical protein
MEALYAVPTVPPGNEAVVICSVGGLMTSVNARCAVWAAASVTRIVTPKLPTADGVPVMDPPLLSVSPLGNAPAMIEYVYGVVPPVETSVVEYAVPTCPLGNEAVLSTSGAGLIVTEYCCVATCAPESVALTVKVLDWAVVGVPEKTPALLIVIPVGSAPAEIVQVTGAVPPLNVMEALYAVPTVPLGNEAVVIWSGGGLMTSVNARCAVCAAASVTRIVTPKLPAADGVPVMEPPVLNVRPPGNAPAITE